MRKLLFGLGTGGAFSLLILGLILLIGFVKETEEEPEIRRKEVSSAKEQTFDEDYMAFYDLGEFATELPVLFINTLGNNVSGDSPSIAEASLLNSANDGKKHMITERPDFTLHAGIKYRGASSRHFDKRQYSLTFYKDPEGKKKLKYDFLGMGAADSWILHGPFLDKSLARNYLVYTLGAEIMEWTPECRYIEVFVDGRYQGVYLVVERVEQGEERIALSDYSLLSGETAYIVSRDREGSDISPLQNYGKTAGYTNNDLYVEYPSGKSITEKEFQWITNDISTFEMALYGEEYRDERFGYAAYIDVDNFVDYYIINEVVLNHDAGDLSTYTYKDLNGKLKMVLWDYNNSYDNYQWFAIEFDSFYLTEAAWYKRLLKDPAFVRRIVERYRELRGKELKTEHLLEILDRSREILGEAIDRNYKVWGYTFKINLLSGRGRDITSFEQANKQLREAIIKRFAFLDAHITDLYEFCED